MISKTALFWPAPVLFSVGLALTLNLGCASSGLRTVIDREDLCIVLDSLYDHSGFDTSLTLVGKATVDANQYRIRGIVSVETRPPGDIFFEFTSSMLFGNRIEDFFCSIVDDTLRLVDRERGQFFEGSAAEDFLSESLAMDFGVRTALGLALGGHPRCQDIGDLRIQSGRSGSVVSGRVAGESFRLEFGADGGPIEQVLWPVPDDHAIRDRLRVEYDWGAAARGGVVWSARDDNLS